MAKSEIAHLLVFVGLFLSFVSSEMQFETCNKNLKRDRYVSRNNVNSSCGCDESRKTPRIIAWSNLKRKCSFMNIDNDGNFEEILHSNHYCWKLLDSCEFRTIYFSSILDVLKPPALEYRKSGKWPGIFL